MIFKFDKSGNMEDTSVEGDIQDMARKSKEKDRFNQMDMNVVNQVKEEVINAMAIDNHAEEDQEMIQQEMGLGLEETASASDMEKWEEPRKVESNVLSLADKYRLEDEQIQAQRLREAEELRKGEDGKDQMSKENFNQNYDDLQKKKDELVSRDTPKSENELPDWEIENCSPVIINKKVGKYSTQMSCGLLATMVNDGVIYYNENTQRSRKKKSNGETTPYLMASKVKKIYNELIAGELNGMLITLNARVLKDEEGNILNPLSYDEDSGTLMGSGKLDAVDGWHRLSSCVFWLKKWNIKKNQKTMPSPWDYEFITAIEHKEEVKAGLIFKEYGSMQLKIQASKVKFLDVYDFTNMIVRRLMNSSLRDRVEVDKTRTKGTNAIVTFGTLSDSIKKNYKITTEDDVDPISNHLNKFFNKLINLFPEYLGNISKEKRDLMREKDDLTLELLMFHGYIAISFRLYGKDDWESKLSKLRSIIQIGQWKGTILQSDCPIWDRIFTGGDTKKIVSGSSTVAYVSKTLGDYIEFGIDYTVNGIKEEDTKKLEKLNK